MNEIQIEDREKLLEFARKTIIMKNKIWIEDTDINNLSEILKQNRGGFVTINKYSKLRGCIGYILPIYPLYKTIIENAYNCAYCDPRFPPVTNDEFEKLHIEISVLSFPRKLIYKNPDDLLKQLTPLVDGVIIKKGSFSSTFLPQVWEQLPDKKEFLQHLCMKAGLKQDEWEEGKLEIEIYNAELFEEKS